MSYTYLCHLCTDITYLPTYLDSNLILLDNLMVTYLPTYLPTYLTFLPTFLYLVCHLRHIHVSHVGVRGVGGARFLKESRPGFHGSSPSPFFSLLSSRSTLVFRHAFFALKKGIHLIRGSILHSALPQLPSLFFLLRYIYTA